MRNRQSEVVRELKGQIKALEKALKNALNERDFLRGRLDEINGLTTPRKAKNGVCASCGSDNVQKVTLPSLSGVVREYLRCKVCKTQKRINQK